MSKNKKDVEDEFLFQILAVGLPLPLREYRAIPLRRYRWDFAWEGERYKLLVEINGSTWVSQTGHTSGSGIARDYLKHNLAVLAGWRVLFFTTQAVRDGSAISFLEKMLKCLPR
jgi:very-short-patch-repair endonuclease